VRNTLVIASLSLVGCSTTASDLREREPVATFHTDKPVAEVAQCLSESISRIGGPSVLQGQNETTITFVQQDATTLFIAISSNGDGRVWRVNKLIPYRGALDRCT
jgi:hypothetical protein